MCYCLLCVLLLMRVRFVCIALGSFDYFTFDTQIIFGNASALVRLGTPETTGLEQYR